MLAFNHWHGAAVYTVLVLVLVHVLEREWAPYVDPLMSNFSHGLSWQIVMSVVYMQFLDSGALSGPDAVWYSMGLLCFNVGLMGVLAKAAIGGIQKLKRMAEQLGTLNLQLVKDKAEDKKNPKLVWKATSKTKNVVKWTGVVPFEDGIFLETGLRFRGSGTEKRGWQLTSASANALLSDAWSAFSHFRV